VTVLVGNALPVFLLVPDSSTSSNWYTSDEARPTLEAGFRSEWWPGGRAFIGDGGADVGMLEAAKWHSYPDLTGGANGRLGIAGVTRDQYGSPVGSVVCKLFHALDDALVVSVVSDAVSGEYLATTHFSDSHYVVFFGPGGLTGATINTLLPN
jgi:hypothetical protein